MRTTRVPETPAFRPGRFIGAGLEALVGALPVELVDALAAEPLEDSDCGVCTVLKPNGTCVIGGLAGDLLEEWHRVFPSELANWFGGDYDALRSAWTEDPRIHMLALTARDAIGAARCLSIYQTARLLIARR